MVTVTRHAKQRVRERVGIPARAVQRYAETAYKDGLRHSELTGGLLRYIDGVYLSKRKANDIRVYGEYAFLFQDTILITIINIPNRYKRAARQLQKGTRNEHTD